MFVLVGLGAGAVWLAAFAVGHDKRAGAEIAESCELLEQVLAANGWGVGSWTGHGASLSENIYHLQARRGQFLVLPTVCSNGEVESACFYAGVKMMSCTLATGDLRTSYAGLV